MYYIVRTEIHKYIIMMTKITITNENRSVVIPLDYDETQDCLVINEIQIDPLPEKTEDISKDFVLLLTRMIMNTFNIRTE